MKLVLLFIFTFFVLLNAVWVPEAETKNNKKRYTYILCQQLTEDVIQRAKFSKKKTERGIIIVITAPKSDVVQQLHDILMECEKRRLENIDGRPSNELLLRPKIQFDVSYLNNGIYIELSSDIESIVNKIHQMKITRGKGISHKKRQK
jgi:hypothetical protein